MPETIAEHEREIECLVDERDATRRALAKCMGLLARALKALKAPGTKYRNEVYTALVYPSLDPMTPESDTTPRETSILIFMEHDGMTREQAERTVDAMSDLIDSVAGVDGTPKQEYDGGSGSSSKPAE